MSVQRSRTSLRRKTGDTQTEQQGRGKNHSVYPFGMPDGKPGGGRDEDPLRDFVLLKGRQFRYGLGMDANDRRVRVIVGRKGAGKTLYLRRLQAAAAGDPALYADDWQIDHPPSKAVIRVLDGSKTPEEAIERWERIWHRAILRSLATHFLNVPRLIGRAELGLEGLRAEYMQLCRSPAAKSSPYQQVNNILFEQTTIEELDRHLVDPIWGGLADRLKELLTDSPPIAFYLDALDDHFEQAPVAWLACQMGLCLQALSIADQYPRLHVVVTVRELVYSALLESEHQNRYKRNERIRALDWNAFAIERLLEEKLSKLSGEYLLAPSADDPLERWLGFRCISNAGLDPGRSAERELLKDYLLRHTRLIPRDIVQLGNLLCNLIDRASDDGRGGVTEADMHRSVRRVARDAGREELLIVANRLTTAAMPRGSAEWDIDGVYATDISDTQHDQHTWQHDVRSKLIHLLKQMREDRITRKRLEAFVNEGSYLFNNVDIVSILWQHGLLGYVEGPRKTAPAVFYAATGEDPMYLPIGEHGAYALHPILIDAVGPPLRGVGKIVRPY